MNKRAAAYPSPVVVAVVCLSYLFELNFVFSALPTQIDYSAAIGPSILAGRPAIAAFQSRLLGPVLQHSIELLGIHRNYAFAASIVILLGIVNLIFLIGSRRLSKERAILLYATSTMAWVFLFDPSHIFLWDFIDTAIFLALSFVALGSFSERLIPALFAIALCNRESAAFVGLWVLISSWQPNRVNPKRAIVGVLLIALTAGYVILARHALLVSTKFPGDVAEGTFIAVKANVNAVVQLVSWPIQAPLLAAICTAMCLFGFTAISGPDRQLSLFILSSIIISYFFGYWFEPRVILFLSPFIGLLIYRLVFQETIARV